MQHTPESCVDNAALTPPPKPLSLCGVCFKGSNENEFSPILSLLEKNLRSLKERLEDCLTPLCSAPHPQAKGHPGVPWLQVLHGLQCRAPAAPEVRSGGGDRGGHPCAARDCCNNAP